MIRKYTPLLLLIVVMVLVACGRSPEMTTSGAAVATPPFVAEEAMEAEAAVALNTSQLSFTRDADAVPETAVPPLDIDRLIIRNGEMSIVVSDTEAAMATIADMVAENEGWVVKSSVFQYSESENAMTGSMTLRVPAEGFDSFMEAVRRLANEVTRISTSGQDVTEEYVDLTARLENLEATAERVRSFLDEARNVEEALSVNQELSRLESEIESLKGRIQYLEQSAAFSTIQIDLTPDELAQPLTVGNWEPQGVAREAIEALVDVAQSLANVVIWLVIFILPILLVLSVPLWLIIRFVRRRMHLRQA